jgi:hypothetical protein
MEIEVPGMYVILSDQVSPPRLCAVHVPNLSAIFVYRAGCSTVLLNAVLEVSIDV